MKLLTWNVNGYKSAYEKGDLKKILNSDYDIICLQEVKNSDIESIKLQNHIKLFLINAPEKDIMGLLFFQN